jgi:hypothetical protein
MKNVIGIAVFSGCLAALEARVAHARELAPPPTFSDESGRQAAVGIVDAGSRIAGIVAPAPDGANVEQLDIAVTVVDANSRRVAGAIVEAVGIQTTRVVGRTDADGALAVQVPRGERLQARAGSAISSVEVAENSALRLVVRLHNIGSVTSRIAHPEDRTSAASARALISGDVAGGLNYVPNYRSAAQGGSGRESLNGVPLDLPAPPGTRSASGGIPSDLISSFDAVQADDGSYPDYHLLSPTPDFSGTFSAGAASFDGSLWKTTIAGPHGNLHYALALATGGDEGALAGQTFLDQSGVHYNHGSDAHHTDVSLTGNTKLGAVNLSFLGFDTNHSGAYVNANQPGPIVQGLGPGNRTTGDNALEFLLATWSHGRDSFSAIDGVYRGGAQYDLTHALTQGVPTPSYSGYRYSGRFDTATWTRSFGASSLSLKASSSANLSNGFSEPTVADSQSGSRTARTRSQSLGSAFRIGTDKANAGASLTAKHIGGVFAGSFLEAAAFAGKRIAGTDARLSVSTTEAQSEEAAYATSSTLAPPQTSTVVCEPATSVVGGPADVGTTHPRSRTIALSLARGAKDGSIRAGAFRSDISNALVPADVGGLALPAGYAAGLSNFFDTLCPGQTLTQANSFVQQYETVNVLRQAEVYLDASRQLGPVSLEAFYETFADAPAQTPPGFAGLPTTLMRGQQLPNVPLHRAGLTVAFARRATTLAMGARLVSANNDVNLPSHVAFDAGLRVRVSPGTLEASVQNLFDSYGGVFNSPRYAVPLATTGPPISTLATPTQRTWTLRYTVGVGPHA